jgi:hypothetical protein
LGPHAVSTSWSNIVRHLEAGAHDEGQQPLLKLTGEIAQSDADGVGQRERRRLGGPGGIPLAFFGVVRPVVPARPAWVWESFMLAVPFPDRMS